MEAERSTPALPSLLLGSSDFGDGPSKENVEKTEGFGSLETAGVDVLFPNEKPENNPGVVEVVVDGGAVEVTDPKLKPPAINHCLIIS